MIVYYLTIMSVQRSNKLLDQMAMKMGLTEAGKQWLTIAIDPFHDTPTHCCGYPDTANQNSVLQCIKQSKSITSPSTMTTATWEFACHLESIPNAYTLTPATDNGAYITVLQNGAPGPFQTVNAGGLKMESYNTGASYDPLSNALQIQGLTLPPTLSSGAYRIIGAGFEIINTTSQLYIQGVATVYRQDSAQANTAAATLFINEDTLSKNQFYGYESVLAIESPPLTIAAAVQLPGTLQWEAKAGCYVQATLNSTEIPINNRFTPSPYYYKPTGAGFPNYFPTPVKPNATNNTVPAYATQTDMTSFNPCGCILSGLSPQTTLTVNLNYYVERFPDISQGDLVLLSQPSPAFDPMALEFYSNIVRQMPVGCKQGENSLGSWFKGAVQTARDWVAPIASLFPHPAAQALSKGLYVGGAIADNAGRQAGGGVNLHDQHAGPILSHALQKSFREAPAAAKKKVKKEVEKEVKKEVKSLLHAGEKKKKKK